MEDIDTLQRLQAKITHIELFQLSLPLPGIHSAPKEKGFLVLLKVSAGSFSGWGHCLLASRQEGFDPVLWGCGLGRFIGKTALLASDELRCYSKTGPAPKCRAMEEALADLYGRVLGENWNKTMDERKKSSTSSVLSLTAVVYSEPMLATCAVLEDVPYLSGIRRGDFAKNKLFDLAQSYLSLY